ncbi:hypothetical protein PRZ48_011276 [Zasmidium cellare]|uniref:Alcohol dehydrogenase-like N-terminal domain-containing protein n=1 Tax=Zasmidium cellare TaxID=395010 RepID=A0ABR0EAW8_ZASCE|nr:hypothetical protein PRZ48_011276 [Zasmidium cellare]
MAFNIPTQHKALIVESLEDPIVVKTLPTPQPFHGSAVVKVLAADIISYHREIYNGKRHYVFPMPLVPGSSCIGRIASVGPDATRLQPGQLVYVDCTTRSRDDSADLFLSAINDGLSEGSKKLMRDIWRDGAFAEYQRVPLENCIPLDEDRLCTALGYTYAQLMYMSHMLVAYGGLRDIGLEPGQTVVICPATGGFGGAGVHVAVAMGARVIAMGRNEVELKRIKETIQTTMPANAGIETVKITGDEAADATSLQQLGGSIDAILDLTPPEASQSPHTKSAAIALKYAGRISIMGLADAMSSPSIRWQIIGKDIMLKGKLMYSRDDMIQFVKMLERGLFPKGKALAAVKSFGLEDHKAALDEAAVWTGLGKAVVFEP